MEQVRCSRYIETDGERANRIWGLGKSWNWYMDERYTGRYCWEMSCFIQDKDTVGKGELVNRAVMRALKTADEYGVSYAEALKWCKESLQPITERLDPYADKGPAKLAKEWDKYQEDDEKEATAEKEPELPEIVD